MDESKLNKNLHDTDAKTPLETSLVDERRAKLTELRKSGNAFPNDFRRDSLTSDLHRQHGADDNATLEAAAKLVRVAGRMVLKRVMGKASFATIQDMSGRIQLYISNDLTGESAHQAFKHHDLGDIIGAQGGALPNQNRRTLSSGNTATPSNQITTPATGEVPRLNRSRTKVSPTLS